MKFKIVFSIIVLKSLLLLWAFLIASSVFSQEALKYFTIKQGLTQNTVTAIFRSANGMLWIGTQDGLNRFDGYSFSHFRHDPDDEHSLSDQYVTTIHQDAGDKIWVGTRHGLNLFQSRSNDFIRIYPDAESRNKVQSQTQHVFSKGENEIIVSVASHLYNVVGSGSQIKRVNTGNIDPDNVAYVNGKSWHVWNKDHVCVIEDCLDSNHQKLGKKSFGDMSTDMVFADHKNKLWYITNRGDHSQVSIYDMKEKKWTPFRSTIPSLINQIVFDELNNPWIATLDGLYHMDGNDAISIFKVGNEKVTGKVLTVYPDKEGLLWIGFADKGLALYNQSSRIFSVTSFDQINKTVFTSLELEDGSLLLGGASGAALQRPGENKWTKLYDRRVSASTLDGKGNIWLGTQGSGILVLNKAGKQIAHYTHEKNGPTGNVIFHLRYDREKRRIFVATRTGLSVFDESSSKWISLIDPDNESHLKAYSGTYVLHSAGDNQGNTWVSSNGGLDVFNSELKLIRQFRSDTDTGKISRTIITAVAFGTDNSKWISTLSNGVYQYTDKKFYHFGIKEGLASNVCYGVATDVKGRIWVSTSRGINMIDLSTNQINSFGEDDGIAMADYTISSTLSTKSGLIHVGSTEGLVKIDPMQYKEDRRKLNVYLNQVLLNYEKYPIDKAYKLQPETKVVSFGFSAPTFINPGKVVYQYRLKGFENNWITIPSDDRRVTFTNLPYKSLILELRASYHIATIDEAPITILPIQVMPPFWRSPLFIILVLLFSMIMLVIGIRLYLRRKLEAGKRKAEIEQTIYKERERISRDLHDRLGAYAAAIKNNVVRLEKSEKMTDEYLQHLKENAEEMVMALRETIWALQLHEVSITQLSDRFKTLVKRIASNYPEINIQFKEDITRDNELSPGEGIHLMRIMQEVLTNALKHAQATEILVSIQSASAVVISIVDNGKGFDVDKINRGQGLQNMEQRAHEAGFGLTLQSGSFGTNVSISLKQQPK